MTMPKMLPLILIVALALVIAGCAEGGSPFAQEPEGDVPTPTPTVERSIPIEVTDVITGDISEVLAYTGNLGPEDDLDLMSRVIGQVDNVLVEVGDVVEQGDIIATIDRDTYLAQYRQAQASLTRAELNLAKMELGSRPEEMTAAQAAVQFATAALNDVANADSDERTQAAAQLASAEAALQKAQSDYDKIAWADDVGQTQEAVALQQATINYENALATYNIIVNPRDATLAPLMTQLAQAELNLALTRQPFRPIDFEIAQVDVDQAQAALDLANINLEDTSIEAPFDGVVAEVYISEGAMVGQSALLRLISSNLEVSIDVDETRIGDVFVGQSATMNFSAYPGESFDGVVTEISPIADQDTRTFSVKVSPVDTEGKLRSGMFADVALLGTEQDGVPLVPVEAVFNNDGQSTVFVVAGERVEMRAVETGLSSSGLVEIRQGLEPGEAVVTAGQNNLQDGTKIEISDDL